MDVVDRACHLETAQRQQAIDNQRARQNDKQRAKQNDRQCVHKPPLERAGVRVCLDCHNPINPARLCALPQSVRCVECQQIYESQ